MTAQPAPTLPRLILEDGPLLAVDKPAGWLTQGGTGQVPSIEEWVKSYLRETYQKPGNVYLGIPQRLDRPVSGVVVFARNSKAAARLAEQFRERSVRKRYWAIVEGTLLPQEGELSDWLVKDSAKSHVEVREVSGGARESRLAYRVLATSGSRSLLEIEPLTGRTHQIRVQLASRGCPIVGDRKYGSSSSWGIPEGPHSMAIALHARSLTLKHPVRYDTLTLTSPVPREMLESFPEINDPGATDASG